MSPRHVKLAAHEVGGLGGKKENEIGYFNRFAKAPGGNPRFSRPLLLYFPYIFWPIAVRITLGVTALGWILQRPHSAAMVFVSRLRPPFWSLERAC